MSAGRDPEAAARAKRRLVEKIGNEPWCTGVGIAPSATGGLVLRINVDPKHRAGAELPRSFDGFDVEVVEIRSYRQRD
jgi:hypothetical protein